jgi:hypothetical protein
LAVDGDNENIASGIVEVAQTLMHEGIITNHAAVRIYNLT